MKINIRKATFETNSSSMHSLVVMKENKNKNEDEELKWDFNEKTNTISIGYSIESYSFGRYPFNMLLSWIDKARYLIASYDFNEVEKIVDEIIKHFINAGYPADKCQLLYNDFEVYNNQKSGPVQVFSYDTIGYNECSNMIHDFFKNNNISYEEFIFNPKYGVVVDGDEYCIFKSMLAVGLIDRDNIETLITSTE